MTSNSGSTASFSVVLRHCFDNPSGDFGCTGRYQCKGDVCPGGKKRGRFFADGQTVDGISTMRPGLRDAKPKPGRSMGCELRGTRPSFSYACFAWSDGTGPNPLVDQGTVTLDPPPSCP